MTPQTRPATQARLSRRALGLGIGLAGGLGLTGCALNNPLSDEATPAARAVHDLAPDVAIAVQAVTLIRAAQSAVTATGAQHAGLAARLAGLLDAHRTHLAKVVDAVPSGVDTTPATGTPYAVPATPAAALTQLTTTERGLHDELVGLALRAQSGPFARLLGSMAAALSQQLRELVR
ncbi:hypothetical protein ACVW00_002594 [Marmoricola sp. URHA0025 HA25]